MWILLEHLLDFHESNTHWRIKKREENVLKEEKSSSVETEKSAFYIVVERMNLDTLLILQLKELSICKE